MTHAKRWLPAFLLAVLFVVSLVMGLGTLNAMAVDDGVDTSFYAIASSSSASLDAYLSGEKTYSSDFKPEDLPVSSAGAFLGYVDQESWIGGLFHWAFSSVVASANSYLYTSITQNGTGGLVNFARYGSLLRDLGFDNTATQAGAMMDKIIRGAGGLLIKFFFFLSTSVNFIFQATFSILGLLNPINWFYRPSDTDPTGLMSGAWDGSQQNVQDALGGSTVDAADVALSGIRTFGSSWYNALYNLGWQIVLPLCLAFTVVGILLFAATGRARMAPGEQPVATKLKRFFLRFLGVCLIVPLCISMYTVTLNQLQDDLESNGVAGGSADVVLSTFLDFEAWAETSQLAIPAGRSISGVLDSTDADATISSSMASVSAIRDLAYSVNAESYNLDLDWDEDDDFRWQTVRPSDIETSDPEDGEGGSVIDPDASQTSVIYDMLDRYIGGDFYYATDFEGSVFKEGETSDAAYKDMTETQKWLDKADTWMTSSATDSMTMYFTDGSLVANTSTDGIVEYSSAGPLGLSTLSMYNYLTSSFKPGSVTVYSGRDVPTTLNYESHYSVNLIGGDAITGLLYYCNALVMLVCVTLIGWGYAISMLLANLKRSIRVLTSIPFTMLGSLGSMARLLTLFVIMIMDILLTFFLYQLVTGIVVTLPNLIEAPLANIVNGSLGQAADPVPDGSSSMTGMIGAQGVIVPFLALIPIIISIVVEIAFFIMAMRLRKSVIKGVEKELDNVIHKLVLDPVGGVTQPKTPAHRGAVSQLAGAAVSGAAMAARDRAIDRSMNGDKNKKDDPTQVSGSATAQNNPDNHVMPGDRGQDTSTQSASMGERQAASSSANASQMQGTNLSSNMSSSGGVSGGGEPHPGGAIATRLSGQAFAENNERQQQKEQEGAQLLSKDSLQRTAQEHKEKEQAEEEKMDAAIAMARGQVGSVTKEEQIEEDAREEEKALKKEANKRELKAAAQAAVGAAEIAADASTGGAAGTTGDGVKNLKNGLAGMSDAKKDKAAAHEKVTKEKAARINDAANESRGGNSRRDAARESLAREHLSRDSRDGTSVRESDKVSFGVGAPGVVQQPKLGENMVPKTAQGSGGQNSRQTDRGQQQSSRMDQGQNSRQTDRGQQQSSHMDQGQTHVHQTAQGGTTNVHQTVQGGPVTVQGGQTNVQQNNSVQRQSAPKRELNRRSSPAPVQPPKPAQPTVKSDTDHTSSVKKGRLEADNFHRSKPTRNIDPENYR